MGLAVIVGDVVHDASTLDRDHIDDTMVPAALLCPVDPNPLVQEGAARDQGIGHRRRKVVRLWPCHAARN